MVFVSKKKKKKYFALFIVLIFYHIRKKKTKETTRIFIKIAKVIKFINRMVLNQISYCIQSIRSTLTDRSFNNHTY
jgi:hypothetical protein